MADIMKVIGKRDAEKDMEKILHLMAPFMRESTATATVMVMETNSILTQPSSQANGKMTKDTEKAKTSLPLAPSTKEPTRKVRDQASANTLGLLELYLSASTRVECDMGKAKRPILIAHGTKATTKRT